VVLVYLKELSNAYLERPSHDPLSHAQRPRAAAYRAAAQKRPLGQIHQQLQ
jgi:hypothetical protein